MRAVAIVVMGLLSSCGAPTEPEPAPSGFAHELPSINFDDGVVVPGMTRLDVLVSVGEPTRRVAPNHWSYDRDSGAGRELHVWFAGGIVTAARE